MGLMMYATGNEIDAPNRERGRSFFFFFFFKQKRNISLWVSYTSFKLSSIDPSVRPLSVSSSTDSSIEHATQLTSPLQVTSRPHRSSAAKPFSPPFFTEPLTIE